MKIFIRGRFDFKNLGILIWKHVNNSLERLKVVSIREKSVNCHKLKDVN